jgi:hypothetical protein
VGRSPAELAQAIKNDTTKWMKFIQATSIKAN